MNLSSPSLGYNGDSIPSSSQRINPIPFMIPKRSSQANWPTMYHPNLEIHGPAPSSEAPAG
ncbi:hypothetical protein PG994_004363 [Apiospora phragmitis]|uniref:Uncharacterized protein n=1 Tax=Apiospora phragmitis TaxID=2905665 RepID=A0ABR1VQD8_9PEZI